MKSRAPGSFGAHLKALRETAGFTQEELATIAGLSVHAVSALERGERRRPHVETVRALAAALDLASAARDALLLSARATSDDAAADELSAVSLPLPLTTLLGRDAELQTLQRWFSHRTARLITLIGPGGVGKSRLALELARAIATEGTHRVLFVPLTPIRSPAFVASALAEAFGLADLAALDLPNRARLALGDRATLLVLDNFEHVLDAAPMVGALLRSVPPLSVLTTSRSPLRLRGEREFALGPLALAANLDSASPADLLRSPAIRLFVERVRDVQPEFRLTAANGPAVTAICQRLDALPLALELAAPWIKMLTPESLLGRLEHDVLLASAGPRDLPQRQQTMNATIAWSYQLLDPEEQRAFRRFGALPGLFPIDAAAEVLAGRQGAGGATDQALRAAAGLIDKSLLLRAETSAVTTCPLYYMLETVRAYAVLELTAAGERDDALEGVVRYAISEATLAAAGLIGPAEAEWLDRAREDLESYRSAMSWLIERRRPAEACQIASGLMFFFLIRGYAIEGQHWYEQILRLPSLSPATESRALLGAAMMSYSQGSLESARAGLTRALALAHDAGDLQTVAEAEHLFGHVEHAAGNAGAARDRFHRGVAAFRTLAIPWGIGSALTGLAWVALAAGETADAERLLEEATSVLQAAGPWFLSLVRYLRAILAVRRGNADEAIVWVRESLTCIRELQDRFAFVYALVPLAAAVVIKGDDARAARLLGARDAVTERTGARVADRWMLDLIGDVERQVRARLGADRWARAYAAGRKLSIDALLKEIEIAPA
ncbi:MAG TPA: helix-turn-helix domain-containing protein [Vicinamibacterales bacterium]|nr:helix-turn-helix domain-containing protein [Vicinamibacterales bacterium]